MSFKRSFFIFFALFITSTLLVSSCSKKGPFEDFTPDQTFDGTLYDYMNSQPTFFKYMLYAMDKAGLSDLLKGSEDFTLFLPTDQSLLSAMDEYNVFRQLEGKPKAAIDDIDSTSWRFILLHYLTKGKLTTSDFEGIDGREFRSMAMRNMHGIVIKHDASGAKELGTETIRFSDLNGSRFTRDWISIGVVTPNIHAKNGIIHVLANRHILGFNYFVNKAEEAQNIYSTHRAFATGSITTPNKVVELWQDKVKILKRIDDNSVSTEAGDSDGEQTADGVSIVLNILPSDSIAITPAPWSTIRRIEQNGPCYFDTVDLKFVLNYQYEDVTGVNKISETIRYQAESAFVH